MVRQYIKYIEDLGSSPVAVSFKQVLYPFDLQFGGPDSIYFLES